MMRNGYCFGFVLITCAMAAADSAIYQEREKFEEMASSLSIQGFEEPFETSSTVNFPGFSVSEESLFANVSSRTDYVSVGNRSLGFTWNGNQSLTFAFDTPIDAFAADILDFGTCCGATVLNVASDTGDLSAVAAVGGDLERGNKQFFGFISDSPFSTLTFTSDQNSDNDLIIFDEVAFRAVPEPTCLKLIIASFASMLIMRRRFERKTLQLI